jgi:IclR family transcriptional regulator, KDG regulon repressor
VLDEVANHPDGTTLGELAKELNASRSTLHRFLMSLVDAGYVEQDAAGRYRLGLRVLRLASSLLGGLPFRTAARAELGALVMATGETAQACMLDGPEVVYVDEIDSPHPLRLNTHVGTRLPAHSTAVGKAILAFLPDDERRPLVGWGLQARTARTITDPLQLLDVLADVEALGYAVDDEEDMVGVRCVAAPVFDMRHVVVGSVGIAGPSARLDLADMPRKAQIVVETARRISARLGAGRPDPLSGSVPQLSVTSGVPNGSAGAAMGQGGSDEDSVAAVRPASAR